MLTRSSLVSAIIVMLVTSSRYIDHIHQDSLRNKNKNDRRFKMNNILRQHCRLCIRSDFGWVSQIRKTQNIWRAKSNVNASQCCMLREKCCNFKMTLSTGPMLTMTLSERMKKRLSLNIHALATFPETFWSWFLPKDNQSQTFVPLIPMEKKIEELMVIVWIDWASDCCGEICSAHLDSPLLAVIGMS